jgi:hypothetical protein
LPLEQLPRQSQERHVPEQAVVVASLEAAPEEGAEETIVEVKTSYDYLLSMPINSLTLEKVRRTECSNDHVNVVRGQPYLHCQVAAYLHAHSTEAGAWVS